MPAKWETNPDLFNCQRDIEGKKKIDYFTEYVPNFLDSDPLQDWASFYNCTSLWWWAMHLARLYPYLKSMSVLDCGAKDGQFVEFLSSRVKYTLGIEIAESYVNYCHEKLRPVMKYDVCALPYTWTSRWDIVFSHHLLGLVEDNKIALYEMFRVTKVNGFLLLLSGCPSTEPSPKHYDLVKETLFTDFVKNNNCRVLFNGYWKDNSDEWVLFIEKFEPKLKEI